MYLASVSAGNCTSILKNTRQSLIINWTDWYSHYRGVPITSCAEREYLRHAQAEKRRHFQQHDLRSWFGELWRTSIVLMQYLIYKVFIGQPLTFLRCAEVQPFYVEKQNENLGRTFFIWDLVFAGIEPETGNRQYFVDSRAKRVRLKVC